MPKRARDVPAGRVTALYHKTGASSASMQRPLLLAASLVLRAHEGLEKQPASPLSPRQVLLTDAEDLEALGLRPGALRENIVLHGVSVGTLPSGTVLRFGSEVELRLTFPCEPCGHIVDSLAADVKAKLGDNPVKGLLGRRGVLATVVRGGDLAVDDECCVIDDVQYEPLSDTVKERVRWLLQRVPSGRVVTFMDVIGMVGAPSGFARALPAYLKAWVREGAVELPVHRMTDSRGGLLDKYVPGQRAMLEAEGVDVQVVEGQPCVDLSSSRWTPSHTEVFLQRV